MKQLYTVTIKYVGLAVAEDEMEAEQLVSDGIRDGDCGNDPWTEVHVTSAITSEWAGCLPFGDNGNRTVEEWLAQPEELEFGKGAQ